MIRRIIVVVLFFAIGGYARISNAASVPVFRLDGAITESPAPEGLPIFDAPGESLKDLLARMDKAAKDPAVHGVVLIINNPQLGAGQIEEIRQAVAAIRAAGKDVYAHADNLDMRSYLLLSSASRLSVTPTGDMWIGGVHAESPYLRGLLDKIGVTPDFQTCGAYKSAAEMLTRNGPSKEADEMTNWLLDSIYTSWVNQIAASRKLDADQVKQRIDVGLFSAEKAKAAGLIDAVEQRQDFEAMLRQKLGNDITFDRKYGKPQNKEIDFSNPFAAFKIWADMIAGAKEKKSPGPSVAIVYVDGAIMPGSKDPSPFAGSAATSSDIRKALDKAAEDDGVKAVVLRISSPGGSAVASEIILDATKRVAAKKPFIVSMGNVAGSGGYYVACGSDTIYADETTLTGSIGVVGGKLVTTGMWDKLGITFKEYNRGKNAGLLSSSKPFTDEQHQHMQGWMDEIYGVFKTHVKEARGDRLKKPIDDLAGGRVYTGRQALDLGLVDRIGTLNDAVKDAAQRAKLPEGYAVRVIPEPKNFVEALMEGMSGDRSADDARHVSLLTGATSITDLALPMLKQLDPQRANSVLMALRRVDLIQQESVIVAMPEVSIGQ